MTQFPICQFCEHCYVQMAERGYSELTPGSDFSMVCTLNHWIFDPNSTQAHFRACITAARTCSDFSMNPRIKEELDAK